MFTFQNVRVCAALAEALPEVNAACQAVGCPPLLITQGSYSTVVDDSAQTHAGGGAADFSVRGWTDAQIVIMLTELRRRGFFGSDRPAGSTGTNSPRHVHVIEDGCPELSGLTNPVPGTAAWQIREYRAGRNGLAGRGPDLGPRQFVGTTWTSWTTNRKDIDMTPEESALLKDMHKRIRGADTTRDSLQYLTQIAEALNRKLDDLARRLPEQPTR